MTDVLTKGQRSFCMSRIRGSDTGPEIKLRKSLWATGIRGYRLRPNIYGRPDIYFTRKRVAVFVDGCFWHKCPECFKLPESNTTFWEEKINKNVNRDRKVSEVLEKSGIRVLRFWEHEVKRDIGKVCARISDELSK